MSTFCFYLAACVSSRTVPRYFSIVFAVMARLHTPSWACGCSLVPRELESGAVGGGPTEVRLVDKQNEEYVAPAYVAYGGEGQTMG